MSTSDRHRLFVTGATGKLGRCVIDALLRSVPVETVTAGVRKLDDRGARSLVGRGIDVRVADYERPDTLPEAFAGIDRLLLISSNGLGRRAEQHRRVIDAAKEAGVGLIAYTSLLHADASPLSIAGEHRDTEAHLSASGVPFAVLRNSWYTENYTDLIASAFERGSFLGAAGDGRIASASRADYAEAAARVLTGDGHAGQFFELAGDDSYTLSEFVAAVAELSGRSLGYDDIGVDAHEAALTGAGLPDGYAKVLADADAGAAKGALFDDGRTLSRLIGRSTTPFRQSIAEAL